MPPGQQTQPMAQGLNTLDPNNGLALFTDGSGSIKDKSGGWAWLAFDLGDGEAWGSGGESGTTSGRMEMQAWVEGLQTLYFAFGPLIVAVFSDSEYVGLGAMDLSRGRRKNRDLWVDIDAIISLHSYVQFIHVKGHNGNLYNERVDTLASQGRKRHRMGKTNGN